MNLVFKGVEVRNFLPFGNSTQYISLEENGSTHINGENLDTNSANGCGKSAFINAICYAIYNKPFDNISLQRLINATNNSKNTLMEVRLFFSKGEDEYEIYRCRGESVNIQILKNGEDITVDSVSANDKLVEDIVGISYDLFTKVVIFSGNSVPFLLMPISQQRSQIEELFNITVLSERAVKLKDLIKQTEHNIGIQDAIIKQKEAQLAQHNKQISDTEARILKWDTDQKKNIKTIQDQLEAFKAVDIEVEKQLHGLISELNLEYSAINSKKSDNDRKATKLASDIRALEKELVHLLDEKCPYCLQKYEGANEKIIEKQGSLDGFKTQLEELLQTKNELSLKLEELNSQLNEAKSHIHYQTLTEAIKMETVASTAQERILELQNQENPHIDVLEQLKSSVIVIDYSETDKLKKLLEHQQFLLKLLTDKNSFIRRKIINRTMPFLNDRLNAYTKELGLPHIVKFDDDMSCMVSEYGRELDFGNLSTGEKRRVNMAMSLAFRDVLHQLHAKVNCMFIDEIDSGLDSGGVEQLFKLVKNLARDGDLGLWVISHRPEASGRFDRILTVRKEHGFSTLIVE